MAEWSKAHAWRACNRQKRFLGSNPSLSAKPRSVSSVGLERLLDRQEVTSSNLVQITPLKKHLPWQVLFLYLHYFFPELFVSRLVESVVDGRMGVLLLLFVLRHRSEDA